MNKRITIFLFLFTTAHLFTKAQITIGGTYKPSHTLVVKGQVKIDSVFAGSLSDSLLTIGADSVLHRLNIARIADGSQTRILAGTNVSLTGTGTSADPYVVNSIVPATTNLLGVSGNTLTSTVNGIPASTSLIGSVSTTSTGNIITTTINGQAGNGVNIINSNASSFTQAGGLVNTINGVSSTVPIPNNPVTSLVGFGSSGTPVFQAASSFLGANTTNTLSSTSGTLTSTVDGIQATAPVLVGSSNGLTTTNGNVALGGTLTSATTLTGGANKLSIASTATDGFAVDGTTFSVDAANDRVGIGTNAPATRLDVRAATAGTALRVADGSQGTDKVLVSDANGNGSWNSIPGNTSAITGNLTSTSNNLPVLADSYTGSTITLPPGKWAVSMILLIKLNLLNPLPSGYAKWVRSTLTNSATAGTASTDIVGSTNLCSGSITGPNNYGLVNGILIVNNSGTVSKTYYLWVKSGEAFGLLTGSDNLTNFGTSLWSEDQIIAIPIK